MLFICLTEKENREVNRSIWADSGEYFYRSLETFYNSLHSLEIYRSRDEVHHGDMILPGVPSSLPRRCYPPGPGDSRSFSGGNIADPRRVYSVDGSAQGP